MTRDEFNDLVERATGGIEPSRTLERVDEILWLVVASIGERGFRALEFHCKAFEVEDARNAG